MLGEALLCYCHMQGLQCIETNSVHFKGTLNCNNLLHNFY